jgi:hypothetical protein
VVAVHLQVCFFDNAKLRFAVSKGLHYVSEMYIANFSILEAEVMRTMEEIKNYF